MNLYSWSFDKLLHENDIFFYSQNHWNQEEACILSVKLQLQPLAGAHQQCLHHTLLKAVLREQQLLIICRFFLINTQQSWYLIRLHSNPKSVSEYFPWSSCGEIHLLDFFFNVNYRSLLSSMFFLHPLDRVKVSLLCSYSPPAKSVNIALKGVIKWLFPWTEGLCDLCGLRVPRGGSFSCAKTKRPCPPYRLHLQRLHYDPAMGTTGGDGSTPR